MDKVILLRDMDKVTLLKVMDKVTLLKVMDKVILLKVMDKAKDMVKDILLRVIIELNNFAIKFNFVDTI